MTSDDSSRSGILRDLLARAFAGMFGFVRAVLRGIASRRDLRVLAGLDDRALKDIGLARSDVLAALGEPIHKDGSARLRVRSVSHRARSRALVLNAKRRPAAPALEAAPAARALAASRP